MSDHTCVNCGLQCQSLHVGVATNNYISILGELHAIAEKLPELEKLARRTPPKHLLAEKLKVEQAKVAARAMKERKVFLEAERARYENDVFQGRPYYEKR